MQKFWRFVLLSLVLTAMSPIAAALAEEELVGLTVETADAASGEEVALSLDMSNTQDVKSLQCNLNNDPAALTVISIEPGSVFPAEYTVSNPDTPGLIRVACAALNVSEDGSVLTVHFKVNGGTGSAVTISDASVTRYTDDAGVTDAYLAVTDGGVAPGGALPAPLVTPWVAPTPPPTPTPKPSPTPQPTPQDITSTLETPPAETPEPEPEQPQVGPVNYVMVGVLSALCVLLIFLGVSGKLTGRNRRR